MSTRRVVTRLVHLYTKRIGIELERPALIVVGIENDADVVIAPRSVTVTQVSANDIGIGVISSECNIKAFAVLNQERSGPDGSRLVLSGIGLDVQFEPKRITPLTT